jgi:hypothetical protein
LRRQDSSSPTTTITFSAWSKRWLTRCLIAGVRFAGCPDAVIAEHLNVTVASVRNRGSSDGWVATADYAVLAELAVNTIEQWAADGLLPNTATDETGRRYHAASELIRALDREPGPP